ncbi:TPA: conjugal transfer protein TraD [Legionella pneumophila]|nr:conjugal transfer protein TraD [Legionella pneumophila]HAT2049517.1 conjugal transfer protein TraD [Legionella pneumophila]HAT4009205.1 conjugal transfer protein TraD [Legionella pneumophila]HAT6364321.1 conjugal transfer protein TraD [Legionella pneumophila]HAT6367652.1 conjugal transfer protein TraD [Legionella pneumophila]HAT6371050.1 conjugal transfer protein TraD [Legionella pneumophila]
MEMHEEIEKEKQIIARCEKTLASDKLKKRKADTRRKIELGGLVIKSTLDIYSKPIILGALKYSQELIKNNDDYLEIFELTGNSLLKEKFLYEK